MENSDAIKETVLRVAKKGKSEIIDFPIMIDDNGKPKEVLVRCVLWVEIK